MDKELIEAAAKIAKIKYNSTLEDGTKCTDDGYWNPLKNNSDCFELETIRNINIKWYDDSICAGNTLEFFYDYKMDKNTTRRKAVVLEIYKKYIEESKQYIEEISDKIRQGIPVGMLEALVAIDYQTKLQEEKKKTNIFKKFFSWFLCI